MYLDVHVNMATNAHLLARLGSIQFQNDEESYALKVQVFDLITSRGCGTVGAPVTSPMYYGPE